MTHGKKFLNMRNRKFMFATVTGLIGTIIVLTLILVSPNILGRKAYTDTDKVTDLLKEKRFIHVVEEDISSEDWNAEHDFDLLNKNYFGIAVAIKNNKVYGLDKTATRVYRTYYDNYLTTAVFSNNLTINKVKENNYAVILEAKDIVNKNYLDREFPPDLENAYVKHQLKKVRIEYNRDYLPVKLDIWDSSKKWETIRTYSYPYKNEKDFNKALDDAIEWIKISESEMEEEE